MTVIKRGNFNSFESNEKAKLFPLQKIIYYPITLVMDIFSLLTPVINGSVSAFNLYILFRIITIEKELERERKFFLDFRINEQKTNQEINNRLLNIEMELSKRFSTWDKKYGN